MTAAAHRPEPDGLWLHIRDEPNGGALLSLLGAAPVWAEIYVSAGALAADFKHQPWWRRPEGSIDVHERPGSRR